MKNLIVLLLILVFTGSVFAVDTVYEDPFVPTTPEVFAQGGSEEIDDFVRDLQETFSVSDIDIKGVPIDKQYDGFNITF